MEIGLCRDIQINHGRSVAMSIFPIAEDNVQITLQFQPESFREPFSTKIRWDDLWTHNSRPEVDRLFQNFVCDRAEFFDPDDLKFKILKDMVNEGRKETLNLWDNIDSLPFTDETSIPGYMLREIQCFDFYISLILFDYLFPEQLHSYLRNRMNISNELYRKDMTERLSVLCLGDHVLLIINGVPG